MLEVLLIASTLSTQPTPPPCIPTGVAIVSALRTATQVDGKVHILTLPLEVHRYKGVLDTHPPVSGPANQIMIIIPPGINTHEPNPADRILVVYLTAGGACERFTISYKLHKEAWQFAYGQTT